MELDVKVHEMLEGLACDLANGALADFGEDSIQKFATKCCTNPRRSIWETQETASHLSPCYDVVVAHVQPSMRLPATIQTVAPDDMSTFKASMTPLNTNGT